MSTGFERFEVVPEYDQDANLMTKFMTKVSVGNSGDAYFSKYIGHPNSLSNAVNEQDSKWSIFGLLPPETTIERAQVFEAGALWGLPDDRSQYERIESELGNAALTKYLNNLAKAQSGFFIFEELWMKSSDLSEHDKNRGYYAVEPTFYFAISSADLLADEKFCASHHEQAMFNLIFYIPAAIDEDLDLHNIEELAKRVSVRTITAYDGESYLIAERCS